MVGDTKLSGLSVDHIGWLVCDGRLLNVSDYQFLFNVIGFSFGSNGPNPTQFMLPNPAGRVPGIVGSGVGLTPRLMGANVGEETHTITVGEMPTHTHTVTDPGHTHTGTTDPTSTNSGETNNGVGTLGTANVASYGVNHTHTFTTNSATTGISINNTGGSNAHNNMQPTLFIGNLFMYCGKYNAGSYPFTTGTNIV